MAGKWLPEVDLLRGWAILAVVAIHVLANITNINPANGLVIVNIFSDVSFHYAVPLFILISGVVLAHNYNINYNLKQYFRRRFDSVIPQYIFFTVAYLLLYFVLYKSSPGILQIIYDFLTGNAAFTMWFFALIIQLYLLYPIIEKTYEHYKINNHVVHFLLACLIIQLSYGLLRVFAADRFDDIIIDSLLMRGFPGYLFYFALGIFVGKNLDIIKEKTRSYNILGLLGVYLGLSVLFSVSPLSDIFYHGDYSMALSYNYIINRLLEPLAYIAIFIVLYRVSAFLVGEGSVAYRGLLALGHYSFGIYLVHIIVLIFVRIMLKYVGVTTTDWLFYPIAIVLTLGLSHLGVVLTSYLPWSQYIVGTHNIIKTGWKPFFESLKHSNN